MMNEASCGDEHIFLSPVATPRAPLSIKWNLESLWGLTGPLH